MITNFKDFYEGYHRNRLLPKRIITKYNFTYRHIVEVLDRYCIGKTVLDYGCGVGTIDFYLAKKGKLVTGIEISEKAINIANKSAEIFKLNKKVNFILGDVFNTKFKNKFDFIICSEVLEHLKNDYLATAKIASLLNKKGRVLISVPSKNAPLIKIGAITEFDRWSGHLRRYNMDDLNKLLKKSHLQLIYFKQNEGWFRDILFVYPQVGSQIVRVANRFRIISNILTWIDNVCLKIWGESQHIIVAQLVK